MLYPNSQLLSKHRTSVRRTIKSDHNSGVTKGHRVYKVTALHNVNKVVIRNRKMFNQSVFIIRNLFHRQYLYALYGNCDKLNDTLICTCTMKTFYTDNCRNKQFLTNFLKWNYTHLYSAFRTATICFGTVGCCYRTNCSLSAYLWGWCCYLDLREEYCFIPLYLQSAINTCRFHLFLF